MDIVNSTSDYLISSSSLNDDILQTNDNAIGKIPIFLIVATSISSLVMISFIIFYIKYKIDKNKKLLEEKQTQPDNSNTV